jgi:Lsr2
MTEDCSMTTRTLTTVVDDLDGSTTNVKTVEFGFAGVTYEADLGPANLDKLASALAPFVTVARKKGARSRSTMTIIQVPADNSVIRAWAAANHISIPARGRISEAIRQQYLNAQ